MEAKRKSSEEPTSVHGRVTRKKPKQLHFNKRKRLPTLESSRSNRISHQNTAGPLTRVQTHRSAGLLGISRNELVACTHFHACRISHMVLCPDQNTTGEPMHG